MNPLDLLPYGKITQSILVPCHGLLSLWCLKEAGCPWVLSAELWVTLFVMESCRGRPLVGPSLYTKNHVLLLAWVTLADTFLEPEKNLHWPWVLRKDIDFPGLVMIVSLDSVI